MVSTLTAMRVRRFKRFADVEIELGDGNPVVFIGPNNSGKTSALQALALWTLGVRTWSERREQGQATKRTGVSINRREIISIPILNSYALWRDLRVRKANVPIRIEIEVDGVHNGEAWSCGMTFTSADQDNIRCRPLRSNGDDDSPYRVPDGAREVRLAFLPPMSGLVSQEDLLQPGSIERRISEGRTADVLRNLCYRVWEQSPAHWAKLKAQLKTLFGTEIGDPEYNLETGILSLDYTESSGTRFDLTASGQGFRQTLLLLAYLYTNPNTVLLLDEPDAHLEILRQRQIYQVFTEVSRELGSQVMIATHSEVILTDAAQRDLVIAFVGAPHRVTKTVGVRRALADYGYEHYAQAEQTGWVLYLEGSTDLSILQVLARRLNHPAQSALSRPFVHYVANQPKKAEEHFFAVREAFAGIVGVAIFDRSEREPLENRELPMHYWARRELENYIATPEVLIGFTRDGTTDDLFGHTERTKRAELMERLVAQYIPPIALNNLSHPWWLNTKISDDFLDPLFESYYAELGLPNAMRKTDYHRLAEYIEVAAIDPEISTKLDAIHEAAQAGERARAGWLPRDEPGEDQGET